MPDDDLAWFFPPSDVHDVAVWDRYWQDQVEHGLTPALFDMFRDDEELINVLVRRAARTVLCAGNGMSQEPRALAAAGFEVTAFDLSPVGARHAETWPISVDELDRFCRAAQRTQGGSTQFVVGNLMDLSLCPGPFDAVIERRTLQLFPEDQRGAALDALAQRLKPDGLFFSHCHDGGWRPPDEPVHQVERFFRDRGWVIWKQGQSPSHTGRVAWLEMSTG